MYKLFKLISKLILGETVEFNEILNVLEFKEWKTIDMIQAEIESKRGTSVSSASVAAMVS